MLSILEKGSNKSGSFQKVKDNWNICLAYEHQCQAAVLDIVAHEFFLHKKMLQDKKTVASTTSLSEKNIINNSDVVKEKSNCFLEMDVQLSSWIGDSGIDELTKLYTYCEYDEAVFDHLKVSLTVILRHCFHGYLVNYLLSIFHILVSSFKCTNCANVFHVSWISFWAYELF